MKSYKNDPKLTPFPSVTLIYNTLGKSVTVTKTPPPICMTSFMSAPNSHLLPDNIACQLSPWHARYSNGLYPCPKVLHCPAIDSLSKMVLRKPTSISFQNYSQKNNAVVVTFSTVFNHHTPRQTNLWPLVWYLFENLVIFYFFNLKVFRSCLEDYDFNNLACRNRLCTVD